MGGGVMVRFVLCFSSIALSFFTKKVYSMGEMIPCTCGNEDKRCMCFCLCNAKQERPSSGHGSKKSDMGNFLHLTQAILRLLFSPGHSSEEDMHDKKFSLLLDILVLLD